MAKKERQMKIGTVSIVMVLAIVAMLGFIIWQNFLQSKGGASLGQAESNNVSIDFIDETDKKTVKSTLNGWPVSLEVPSMWQANAAYSTTYNYDARKKEVLNIITIIHPSEKVNIILYQVPFFSADGPCGSSAITHLNKSPMQDNRLVFVEAVAKGSFFLSATTREAATAFTKDADFCFNYRDMINHEGNGVNVDSKEAQPYYKKPFVRVRIVPIIAVGEDKPLTDDQVIIDFLNTKEYLEAKEVVKTLKI